MSHRPIQFGSSEAGEGSVDAADLRARPVSLDLQKESALTVVWDDGRRSVYPVGYLRRMSPSAEARQLREEMARNPLTVLPSATGGGGGDGEGGGEGGRGGGQTGGGGFSATGAELVGRYAVRIEFSDGHRTGIYSWEYLRQIDPGRIGGGGGAGAGTGDGASAERGVSPADDRGHGGDADGGGRGIDCDARVKP